MEVSVGSKKGTDNGVLVEIGFFKAVEDEVGLLMAISAGAEIFGVTEGIGV